MANLSGTLGDVNEAARIVEAPSQSSGLATALGALGNTFESVNSAFNARAQSKRQAAADARADRAEFRAETKFAHDQKVDQRTEQGWAVDAEVAGIKNNLNAMANGMVTPDTITPVAPEVPSFSDQLDGMPDSAKGYLTKAGDSLVRIQQGINQGRMPAIALEGAANRAFNELVNKGFDPGVVSESFKRAGVNAWQGYDRTTADQEAADKSRREEETRAYDAGMAVTPITEGKTREDIIAAGRRKIAADSVLEVQTKTAALSASLNSETRAANNDNKETLDSDAENAGNLLFNSSTDNLTQDLFRVSGVGAPERGLDTTYEMNNAKIRGIAPQYLKNVKEGILNKFRNEGYSASAIARVSASIDGRIKDVLDGLDAGGEAFSKSASYISTSFGLRMNESMPVIRQLRSAGIPLDTIPGLLDTLPPDVKQRVGAELKGIAGQGFEQSASKIRLQTLIAVATGKANVNELDQQQGRQVIQSAVAYVKNTTNQILAGNGDPDTFMAMHRQVTIGAASMTGQSSSRDLYNATVANAGANSAAAARYLIGKPEHREEAELLVAGQRGASARLLSASREKLNATLRSEPYQVLNYNTTTGQYEFLFNDAKWRQSGGGRVKTGAAMNAASGMGSVSAGGAYQMAKPNPSPEAKMLIQTLNSNLAFLTKTNDLDQEAPQGNGRDVAAFWAIGRRQGTLAVKPGKDGSTPRSIYEAQDRLIQSLSKTPEIDTSGSDIDIEGPEGTGKNPRSSATGTGQFIDSTWLSTLRKHAPELIEGKSEKDILAMRSNKELGRKAISWYRSDNAAYLAKKGLPSGRTATALAHFAGPQGAEKLMTSNPDTPVINVLGADAVNGNPQLRGKTVGQTIEWAKGFYRA